MNFLFIALIAVTTLIFGRIYCSSICPMGILQDFIAAVSKKKKKNRYFFSKQKLVLRYVVLIFFIIALWSGFALIPAILDPYSLYGRISSNIFLPVVRLFNNMLAYITDSNETYYFAKTQVFTNGILSLIVSVITLGIIGVLAWIGGRTFCNTLCPAGTILSLLSTKPAFRLSIDTATCNSCGLCEKNCKASCINSKHRDIEHDRCVMCFNCVSICRKQAITYGYSPLFNTKKENEGKVPETETGHDNGRRMFIATAVASSITIPKLLAQDKIDRLSSGFLGDNSFKKRKPVTPAGSLSFNNFTDNCTSCHLCVSKCKSNVLKPAVFEYGLEGFMQPTLVFEDGFCDIDCNTCSTVCPNGAIKKLDHATKKITKIGTAVYAEANCVVNTDDVNCGNCARHCPVGAIEMKAQSTNGKLLPVIDNSKCIGCGSCEYHCPTSVYKAIFVSGESNHSILL